MAAAGLGRASEEILLKATSLYREGTGADGQSGQQNVTDGRNTYPHIHEGSGMGYPPGPHPELSVLSVFSVPLVSHLHLFHLVLPLG